MLSARNVAKSLNTKAHYLDICANLTVRVKKIIQYSRLATQRNECEIDIKREKSQSATFKVQCEESECNAVIKSNGLKKHKRLVHEKGRVKSTIQCDRFDKWVSNVFSLSRHMGLVHNAKKRKQQQKRKSLISKQYYRR